MFYFSAAPIPLATCAQCLTLHCLSLHLCCNEIIVIMTRPLWVSGVLYLNWCKLTGRTSNLLVSCKNEKGFDLNVSIFRQTLVRHQKTVQSVASVNSKYCSSENWVPFTLYRTAIVAPQLSYRIGGGCCLPDTRAIRYKTLHGSERKSLRFVGDMKISPVWLWHDVNSAIR